MKRILLILFLLIGFIGNSMAQRILTGRVTDEKQNPISGVTVVVKGTTTGTIADENGKYSLAIPSDAKALLFTFVGFEPQEIKISSSNVYNVILSQKTVGLEDVIVIGYGTAKKRDLTGSIGSVKVASVENEKPKSVQDLLRGNIAGVQVGFSPNAKPGGSLQIRGINSLLTSTYPLIVLDGVIYPGAVEDINPNDIESIDVLKDASSAAVFGARAANGVIMITTKKGQTGKPSINFNESIGLTTMAKMAPIYSPAGFVNWRVDLMKGLNLYNPNTNTKLYIFDNPNNLPSGVTLDQWRDGNPGSDLISIWLTRIAFSSMEIANYEANKPVDWAGMTFQNGLTQDYNISLSGTKDELKYYWSLGSENNKGIVVGDQFKTIRSLINLEGRVNKWLTVGLSTQFANRDESSVPATWQFIVGCPPYGSQYYDDGITLRYSPTNNPLGEVINPLYDALYTVRRQVTNSLINSLYAKIQLPLDISYQVTFAPRFQWYEYLNDMSAKHELWAKFGGQADRYESNVYSWQLDNLIKWHKIFNNVHEFDVTLLANAEKYQSWSNSMETQGFSPTDALGYHNMSAGVSTSDIISSNDTYSTGDALMGRLFYSFKSKYMATFSVRRDGYSAFGLQHPRGVFPSAALAWVFTDERFLKNDILTFGKLRFSWGSNGNREVGQYVALADMSTGKYVYSTLSGTTYQSTFLYVDRMANPNLKWEKTRSLDVGVDYTIKNGLLDGSIDVYKKNTVDLLVNRSLPSILGFTYVTSNLGEVQNTGIEATLNARIMNKDNFKWKISYTFSTNHNEIVHLYGDMVDVKDANGNVIGKKEADDISNNWFIGHSIGEIWQPKIIGVWQKGQEAQAAVYGQFPGDFHLEDVNNDGKITQADYQFQGQTVPIFRWNFRSEFNVYKNFDISCNFYSYWGNKDIFDEAKNRYQIYDQSIYPDRNNSYVCKYWTPENPTNDYARLYSNDGGAIFDVWRSKSFIRFDNFTIAYTIPSKLLQKVNISSLKLIGTIRNIGYWAPKWNFWDPEYSGPNPRFFTFSVNLTL
ncbi:MAG: SusC/RagA family TonB-linked outer membrane protein [Bacteroidales bacterium]